MEIEKEQLKCRNNLQDDNKGIENGCPLNIWILKFMGNDGK